MHKLFQSLAFFSTLLGSRVTFFQPWVFLTGHLWKNTQGCAKIYTTQSLQNRDIKKKINSGSCILVPAFQLIHERINGSKKFGMVFTGYKKQTVKN